ncbi:hypothetical protein D3C75_886960 [compost metagenome]
MADDYDVAETLPLAGEFHPALIQRRHLGAGFDSQPDALLVVGEGLGHRPPNRLHQ